LKLVSQDLKICDFNNENYSKKVLFSYFFIMKALILFILASIFISSAFAQEEYVLKSPLEAANFLGQSQIIQYYGDAPSEYRLESTITRQEVMKIIAKLSGERIPTSCVGTFSDVDLNGWGCKYIEWALWKWYIAQNALFRPSDNITKTEAMKLILKVRNIPKIQETSAWQEDYMMTAYEYGLISQKYFDFNADASRGWIFQISTATIEMQARIQREIQDRLISDETL
jgi:hypothetical protein